MKTDMEILVDGINELLTIQHSSSGLPQWERERQAALVVLLSKLKDAPFYAITTTTTKEQPIFGEEKENYKCPDCKCEYPRCDCDDCHDERLDNTDFSKDEEVALLQRKIAKLEEAIGKHNFNKTRILDALGNGSNEKMWPPNAYWADAACNVIKSCQGDAEAIASLSKKLNDVRAERDRYKTALDTLSKLGGGNSDSNWIALKALNGVS